MNIIEPFSGGRHVLIGRVALQMLFVTAPEDVKVSCLYSLVLIHSLWFSL